jgi:hypothetical protein
VTGSKRLRQETIVWRDSWAGYDSSPVEKNEIDGSGFYLTDVGWLAKETRDEVILATSSSAHADDERVKHLHGIPKRNIVSRSSRWVRVTDPRKR